MGGSNEKTIQNKAKEVINSKMNDIINFFNSSDVRETYPTEKNISCLNRDKPIIKKIYPDENVHKLYIEIYNFPAFFRTDNGLYTIVNEITIYLEIFFNKWKDQPELENKFNLFIQCILQVDTKKFKELIGIDIQRSNLKKIKQGLEKIVRYFGIESFKEFYLGFKTIGSITLLGGVLGLAAGLFSGITITIPLLAGLGCGIIIGVIGFI